MAEPSNLPPIIQARYDFMTRAREQLIEKRNNLVLLRDIEKLFYDEQNFFLLILRNIQSTPLHYRHYFESVRQDIDTIKSDLCFITEWRKLWRDERAARIQDIYDIEKRWQPKPDCLVKIASYVDDHIIHIAQEISHLEIDYRFRQFQIYWEQLYTQFCGKTRPGDRARPVDHPEVLANAHFTQLPQGHQPRGCMGSVEPRLPSRDYTFIPNRSYLHEYERYLQMFLEEAFVFGPHNFHSDEFVGYIPLEPQD